MGKEGENKKLAEDKKKLNIYFLEILRRFFFFFFFIRIFATRTKVGSEKKLMNYFLDF